MPEHESEYDILVRDREPELIRAEGGIAVTVHIGKVRFRRELYVKIVDELHKALEARSTQELLEKFADVQEVLDTLVAAYGIDPSTLRMAQETKRLSHGAFTKRILLKEIKTKKARS